MLLVKYRTSLYGYSGEEGKEEITLHPMARGHGRPSPHRISGFSGESNIYHGICLIGIINDKKKIIFRHAAFAPSAGLCALKIALVFHPQSL